MLSHHKGGIVSIITGITVFALLVLLMHLNYFLSYGPLTKGQERGYELAFGANGVLIVTSVISKIVIMTTQHSESLPFFFNMGYSVAAAVHLGSFVVFLTDPPNKDDMSEYLLHTFRETHKATPLLERLQHHYNGENFTLECCGIENYLDYTIYPREDENELMLKRISVPDSCCVIVTHGCGKDLEFAVIKEPNSTQIYKKGCLPGGYDRFLGRLDYLTHFGYKSVSYSVGCLFFIIIISIVAFNGLHFLHVRKHLPSSTSLTTTTVVAEPHHAPDGVASGSANEVLVKPSSTASGDS